VNPATLASMTYRGVLFDFAGTLFAAGQDRSKLDGITDVEGKPLGADAYAELAHRITGPITAFARFDGDFAHAWENRDLDPVLHRTAFVEAIRQAGVPVREQAEQLYEQLIDPANWSPYPDAEQVLKDLAVRDIPVAVVSNIGFDIRPAFALHGLSDLVAEYVLSYELGVIKPDRRIFQHALDAIGVTATDAVMIGDSEHADGGIRALGAGFALVGSLPPADRPTALVDAIATFG